MNQDLLNAVQLKTHENKWEAEATMEMQQYQQSETSFFNVH